MTSDMEFEGKTVESAAEDASQKLNVKLENLKYDVISHGSTGIFGLVGSKKARIRVRSPIKTKKETVEVFSEESKETEKAQTEGITETHEPIEEIVTRCEAALQKIIGAISPDTTLSIDRKQERIVFNVTGGNAAVLIGKRGQTLEAIQYLLDKIANKRNERRIRVAVDVEGYLKNRRDHLERLAGRMAQKAVRTGKPMTIGQMNAHDRRIVHLALKNNIDVRTESMGEGPYRKLMVFPKKKGTERLDSANFQD